MHRRRGHLSGGVFYFYCQNELTGVVPMTVEPDASMPPGEEGLVQGSEGTQVLEPVKTQFLDHIAAGQSVRAAAAAIGINARLPYSWRKHDTTFAVAWSAAEEAGTDIIEEEAFRRAVKGVEKPVYRGGEVVGHVADYSDAMLIFLLKSRRPERYGTTGKNTTKDGSGKTVDDLNLEGARDALISKFGAVAASSKTPPLPE